LASDIQLCKIAQPDRAKRKKSDHKPVTHQPDAAKIGEVLARFAAPDQIEPKRQQPLGRHDAMIFQPRPRRVAEVCLNLPEPDKVASWRKDLGDRPDLADMACAFNRTDTAMEFIDEDVDDLGRHMHAGLGIPIKQAVSVAELEQVAVGPYEACPGRCLHAGGGATRPQTLRSDAGLRPDLALSSRPVAWWESSDFLSHAVSS
jgi:hypothetical protein